MSQDNCRRDKGTLAPCGFQTFSKEGGFNDGLSMGISRLARSGESSLMINFDKL